MARLEILDASCHMHCWIYLIAATSWDCFSGVSLLQSRLALLRIMFAAKNLASRDVSSSNVNARGQASTELLKLFSQAEAALCCAVSCPYRVCMARSNVLLVSSLISARSVVPHCHQIILAATEQYARQHALIRFEIPSSKGRQGRELSWKAKEGNRPKSHMVESSPSPKYEAKLAGFHVLARLLSCISFLLKAHAG